MGFTPRVLALLAAGTLLACSPGGRQNPGQPELAPGQGPLTQAPSRTLTIAVRIEATSLSPNMSINFPVEVTRRLFNAPLAMVDGDGRPQPYLAEEVPRLHTDTWRVFPDGAMETTYRLRPGVRWHDGQPLTADDFAFALRVYRSPAIAFFSSRPAEIMSEILTPDARTLVVRWRAPYPEAGLLQGATGGPAETAVFAPLPRHLLEPQFQRGDQEAFASLPYWTTEFVGTGPYRLDRWEPGAYLAGVAFDGHVLGRPKIERVEVRFIGDENTALTNLLAGAVDLASQGTLRFEHGVVLKQEWGSSGRGTVLQAPGLPRVINIQFRPELANPAAILDIRVRRALAHSLDRQMIVDGLFDGSVPMADQLLPQTIPYFAELDLAIVKYPYDVRQTEQLMEQARFRKGGDGVYANTRGEPFTFDLWRLASVQNDKEGAVMAHGWRQAGFQVREHAVPPPQFTDGQLRATFPALSATATAKGEVGLGAFVTTAIPSAVNLWRGLNRGGWSNPEYDQLWEAFITTLDRAARDRQAIQMSRLITEDVGQLFLFHSPNVSAHLAAVRGPAIDTPDTLVLWNIHQWEVR